MDLRDLVICAVDQARRIGATEADVVGAEGETLEVGVRLGEIETLKRSRDRRMAVRLFSGKSSAVCSSADLSPDSLASLVGRCLDLARSTAPDPQSGLADAPGPPASATSLALFDSGAAAVTAEDAIEVARETERAALDFDPRVTNSEGSELSVSTQRLVYGTTADFLGEYAATAFSLSVTPVASDGSQMQQDSWYTAARQRRDLEAPELVGRIAASRAVRRLGARSVPSCEAPVVFDPESAATLLGHLAAAAAGSSLYRGLSFLEGRLGEQIGSAALTIVDDPLLPGGLGSRPFDAEGLPTRRNTILDRGVLRGYLLDSYSGRKLGLSSTASAVRSLGDVPSAGPSNFYLENGQTPPEEILASVEHGLYVTGLTGFGVNPVTGDYSRGASGFWIENGRLAFPVEEVTIAGTLLEMFRRIELLGDDLRFRSRISSPTLKVARMTIAGES